jgi:co-chaperonin GroES (HSP10)
MKYNFNGKNINIPDVEIQKSMKLLGMTKEEAIELWLEDEGYLDNEEQNELEQKAKDNKITATIHGAGGEKKKQSKPKTVKVSDEKRVLFSQIEGFLKNYTTHEVEILKENKLIQVKFGEKVFKIDLIEQRPPKK